MIEYFEVGEPWAGECKNELYPHTQVLLKALHACPYTDVREIRSGSLGQSASEYIVIDAADGTVDAGNPAGIRRRERVAIRVNPDFDVPVAVLTLRKDFPLLSHQYSPVSDGPRILCLYAAAWSTVERTWTPQRFIEQMFWWFRESAQQTLHRDDQPLEQLFYMSRYQLILPHDYADYLGAGGKTLSIRTVDHGDPIILKAEAPSYSSRSNPLRMVQVVVNPVGTTTIAHYPETLGDLQDQLVAWGSDLYDPLSSMLNDVVEGGISPGAGEVDNLLITVWIPRSRNGEIERYDVQGYMLERSLFELAKAFDLLGLPDANGVHYRMALVGIERGMLWRSIPLTSVGIRTSLSSQRARDLSGTPDEQSDIRAVLAGVGALGSVLADLWVRQGWGQWTFVDPDRLMPHNLCRHTALEFFVGRPKAHVVQELATLAFPNELRTTAIATSLLDESIEISTTLNRAELVVDVTTTLDVPRELAQRADAPRTVSLFVTPSGLSSVMLLEDQDRQQRVDGLEGQYYRAILSSEWGQEHLAHHLGDRWVGGGCRDISVRMSNESIHTHAGILARQVRKAVAQSQARICVWASDDESGSVTAHEITPAQVITAESADWTIKYDDALVEKLYRIRQQALPNETGGAILGVTDLKTKTIVIVDVLPTPPDSEASPTHFIRGQEGQAEAMAEVHKRTAGVVDYVGEWHSHPNGCAARPSVDDLKLLDKLHQQMSVDGLPALMVIVGRDQVGVFVK